MQRLKNDGNGFEHHVLDQELSKKDRELLPLNEFISIPTDENLARYIYEHMPWHQFQQLAFKALKIKEFILKIRTIYLWKRYQFEAPINFLM